MTLFGCIPDVEIPQITLDTPFSSTNSTDIVFKASASPMAFDQCGFYISKEPQMSYKPQFEAQVSSSFSVNYKADMDQLGSTLYYQAYVKKGESIATSNVESFVIPQFSKYVTLTEPQVYMEKNGKAKVTFQINWAAGISLIEQGVCYSTEFSSPTYFNSYVERADIQNSTCTIQLDLLSGKTYYLCGYARSNYHVAYSVPIVYVVPVLLPTVTTSAVNSITATTAQAGGSVTNTGSSDVSARGVVWSKNPEPTISLSTKTKDGTGTGTFTSKMTGLTPGTQYYVRAYATNDAGTSYGEEVTFITDYETVDLSLFGTANCYIVPKAGRYRFKATVKGNSQESIGSPVSADVLWESYGTTTNPNVGDIIMSASYENGYVIFTTPRELNDGNAVIAVKNSKGTTLWSWHIWVCEGFYPEETAQVYRNNAGTMMDRNLGATSKSPGDVCSRGLLYQWGRKDPFLSGGDIKYPSSDVIAVSSISWPDPVQSSKETGTIAYSIHYPMVFIYDEESYDWVFFDRDTTRWNSAKTRYDPCPPGWRIPDISVWKNALKENPETSIALKSIWDSSGWNMAYYFTSTTACFYPTAGERRSAYRNGLLEGDAWWGLYWSCNNCKGMDNQYRAYCLELDRGSDTLSDPFVGALICDGKSVRCQKE